LAAILDQPFLLMIAGPNGSGKTSLTRWLRDNDFYLGQYINPDDIAQEIEGSYEDRTIEAQKIAHRRREEYIETKQSFSFETVMSHRSKLEVLVRARQAGFFVQVFFVGIEDSQTNVERVALRVAQGGHDVPLEKIKPRWRRSMDLAAEAILLADQAFVFDNSDPGISGIAPRLVLRWKHDRIKNERWWGETPPTPTWVTNYISSRLKNEFRKQSR
jgi:predicted ABC-type ATPase